MPKRLKTALGRALRRWYTNEKRGTAAHSHSPLAPVVVEDPVLTLEDVPGAQVNGGHPPFHVVQASGQQEPRHLHKHAISHVAPRPVTRGKMQPVMGVRME